MLHMFACRVFLLCAIKCCLPSLCVLSLMFMCICIPILLLNIDEWADVLWSSVPYVCMCCQMYSSALASVYVRILAITQHLGCVLSQQSDRMTAAGKWVSHALSRHDGNGSTDILMDGWINTWNEEGDIRWIFAAQREWLTEGNKDSRIRWGLNVVLYKKGERKRWAKKRKDCRPVDENERTVNNGGRYEKTK